MICPRLARFVFDLPCKSAAGSQSRRFWASLRSTEEQLVAAGTISVSEVQHFDGTLITVPFGTGEPRSTVTEQYQAFLKEYNPEDILVITGSPTSMETFREELKT